MSRADELSKAIGVHGLWQDRLQGAIDTASCDLTVEQAHSDSQCAFGTWLGPLEPGDHPSADSAAVRTWHTAFHIEAARVLQLALNGQKPEAEQAVAAGSDFTRASGELKSALLRWQRA